MNITHDDGDNPPENGAVAPPARNATSEKNEVTDLSISTTDACQAVTLDPVPPLPNEATRLTELEGVIAVGLQSYAEVGNALLEIRDSKLYRASHGTFESYCFERWGISINYAGKLILAAKTVENLKTGTIVPLPANEGQVRPLTSLEPEEQREVWKHAVNTAPNGKVTSKHVQRTKQQKAKDRRDKRNGLGSATAQEGLEDFSTDWPDFIKRLLRARYKPQWWVEFGRRAEASWPQIRRMIGEWSEEALA